MRKIVRKQNRITKARHKGLRHHVYFKAAQLRDFCNFYFFRTTATATKDLASKGISCKSQFLFSSDPTWLQENQRFWLGLINFLYIHIIRITYQYYIWAQRNFDFFQVPEDLGYALWMGRRAYSWGAFTETTRGKYHSNYNLRNSYVDLQGLSNVSKSHVISKLKLQKCVH